MATALAIPVEFEERILPLRPRRLGTRRRREAKTARNRGAAGASGANEVSAPSLDDCKQLATSENLTVAEWMKLLETPRDTRNEKLRYKARLQDTLHLLMCERMEAARRARAEGKAERAQGLELEAGQFQKQWERVHNCQSEWIGYKATCCDAYTRRVAVPIGCNHRLCPLCAWHRATVGRERIKAMFSRLQHPYLLTLTVPNYLTLRKHDYTLFRQRVRAFIKAHAGWIKGGVYSLETTYNRQQGTWHLHAHILLDAATALPASQKYVEYNGRQVRYFTLLKRRLEFAWLQQWDKRWRPRKKPTVTDLERIGNLTAFDRWYRMAESNRVREFDHYENRDGVRRSVFRDIPMSADDRAARTAWNCDNRRMVDVRPVTNREGAAFEVLKYLTKVAAFADLPDAVADFMKATKGARLIQTFGTFYGVKLIPDDVNERDWSHLKCSCGLNHWERCGVFMLGEVEMDAEGRWLVRPEVEKFRSTGHVVTIPIT